MAKYIDALLLELSESSFAISIPMALEMKKLPDEKDEKKYRELERLAEKFGLVDIVNQGNSSIGGFKEYFISQKGRELLDSNTSSINLLKEKRNPLEILFDEKYWDNYHKELIDKRINEADYYFDLLVSVGYSNFDKGTIRKYFREWYVKNSRFDLQIENGDIALEDGDFKMLPSLDKKQIADFIKSFESKKDDFLGYLAEEGVNLKDIKIKNMKELFIMYAWDSEEHKNKVLAFTNKLRESGFDAEMDRLVSQNETATDFRKMMHRAITDYNKVIIVLSRGYKEKADKFDGGVGIEYSMTIKDIERSRKKYILVTFDEIDDSIFPVEFREREVLNLRSEKDWNTLFAKLQDEDLITFSEVGKEKPKVVKHDIGEMNVSTEALKIVSLDLEQGDSSTFGGLLEKIDYELYITLKNIWSKPIKDFNIEVHYPIGTVSTPNQTSVRENCQVVTYDLKDKIFSNQEKQIKFDSIKLRKDNASSVINSDIIIKIYFDEGYIEERFQLSDYLTYNPSGYNQKKLSIDDFQHNF